MNLSKRALGLSFGLVWGFTVLLATWWLIIIDASGTTISTLSKFYFGYTFSWLGGLIGFIWGFVDGFIGGVIIAWLYNLFNKGKIATA
ncbi:MAG: hypothetical protein A2V93_11340 [Ignavibacteria bacterium RBG_16_34_14]|nr:MAG: hypothetical protein A2V93_11340 [Ignavibacteria bacterium RBG_16_34_14]